MAGKGPPPKRSDQRRRTNTPATGKATKAPGAKRVPVPKPDPKWHLSARRWYSALARSGQAVFFEPSDWAFAQLLCDLMSRELHPQPMTIGSGEHVHVEMVSLPPKAASVAAWMKGMTGLLVTEGDRRHAAVELQRPTPDASSGAASVSHLDDARNRLRGTS